MAELTLTGLRGSHTLGALAAFGVLRVASQSDLPQPVRLGWVAEPDWTARLDFPHLVTPEVLIEMLCQAVKTRTSAPELQWREDLKATPAEYRAFAENHLVAAAPDRRETLDFLVAFGSELVMMRNGKGLKPTPLDMTCMRGRNKFLRDICRTLTKLAKAKNLKALLEEALFGPWRQQDDVFAMGWNCEAERAHAYEPFAPTKAKHASVIGAIWLAYEALPLFPTTGVGRRLATAGFTDRPMCLTWPVWESLLTLDTVRSLLGLKALTEASCPREELIQRGIAVVFRSQRTELPMQGRIILRPPVVV